MPPLLPTTIVTGSLGSGKTTLISRILRDPAFSRTAVIVNEFGEIALDHDLIASSDESVLTLATGCLCCAVQTDLARTLMDLHARRQSELAQYDRVLIETSGLSDPAPMLQALIGDRDVAATHQAPQVVTVVDAVHGEAMLAERPEAVRQVALADQLLISKLDVQAPDVQLLARLTALNPAVAPLAASDATAKTLFGISSPDVLADRLSRLPPSGGHEAVETFSLVRETPMPALALAMLLDALAEHCGPRLLRFKGMAGIEEMPGQPAVIHGVRHVVSAPVFLDRWPSDDRTTRLVFIAQGVPRFFPARLLEAIEMEVREEMGQALAEHGSTVPGQGYS